MKLIYFSKTKTMFLCFYGLCIISFYYIVDNKFNVSYDLLNIWWIFYTLINLFPYIAGASLVFFLGFSDKKRWLVNLGAVLSCCALIYYLFGMPSETGLESIAIPIYNIYCLISFSVFTYVVYLTDRISEIISKKLR